ncbi:DUF3592 domain-containing protein [Microbulbifer hainanensis]|uniref:DUF3592 domain-containing protein n=1 Tax=Microbulbifer hainanensis TaxID=2735675 RepID=UPI00186769B0|nr:DUF3592 domain-containing protein [Microbulbifer hainanensis]
MEVARMPRLGGTLFGGLFFLVGLALFIMFTGRPLVERMQMQSWQPMRAEILEAGLESHRDDDGDTTYRATALYRYTFAGNRYQNNRLSVQTGFNSYQQDLYQRLSAAQHQGRAVNGWVDPEDPYEALLNRDIRWSLVLFPGILCSLFMAVGIAVIYLSWRTSRSLDPKIVRQPPWLARSEWSEKGILSKNKLSVWVWWFAALFVNSISLPLISILQRELKRGNYASLVILVFVAGGLFCLFKAVQKSLEQRRYGRVPVVLEPFPGRIGGKVAGYLQFGEQFGLGVTFDVVLKQMRTVQVRRGSKTEMDVDCLWDLSGRGKIRNTTRGARVYFAFEVPEDMPSSRLDNGNGNWWSLEVRGRMQGVDFNREYEIPVFRVSDTTARTASQPERAPDPVSARAFAGMDVVRGKTDFTDELEAMLDIEQRDDGVLIRQAAGKQKLAWPLTIFGILFAAMGNGAGFIGAPILFPIVFSAFGLLLAAVGIHMLITGYETLIGRERVVHRILRLGKVRREMIWPRARLRGLCVQCSGSGGNKGKSVDYYDLLLQDSGGERMKISGGIAGKLAAGQLLDSLSLLTGLKTLDEYKSRAQLKREESRA